LWALKGTKKCPSLPRKAHALSNDSELFQIGLQAPGKRGDTGEKEVSQLGTIMHFKRRALNRAVERRRLRRTKHSKRVCRALNVAAKKTRRGRVYYEGALHGLLFGAELWVVSASDEKKLRIEALKVLGFNARECTMSFSGACCPITLIRLLKQTGCCLKSVHMKCGKRVVTTGI
jgi:hypothetical protein